ncbi:hypothetical protein ACP275_11G075500 [Erythranthe tilingii]
MKCSTKGEKIQAMKNYKRARFLYNLVLYSLTSLITFFVFSYYYSWFPSTKDFPSFPPNNLSVFLNAKCFFIVGNLIVLILIGESKLTRSSHSCSSSSDMLYDEYIAKSRRCYNVNSNEINNNGVVKLNRSIEVKKDGGREKIVRHGEKKKEIKIRTSKSSANICMPRDQENKKLGMRSCKSEVWGESEIAKMRKTTVGKEEEICVQGVELNKRVEAFIARVNKQRLLEAKLVDHYR